MSASAVVSLRAGAGSRALPPTMPGRSAANETSRSGLRASARMAPDTARLNGSVGDSLPGVLPLIFEAIFLPSFRDAASSRRARNPYSQASRLNRITGVMGPRFRGDDTHQL